MKKFILYSLEAIIVLVLLTFIGCTNSINDDNLIGTWVNSSENETTTFKQLPSMESRHIWTLTFNADKSYNDIREVYINDTPAPSMTFSGKWKIVDNLLILEPLDDNTIEYKIIDITSNYIILEKENTKQQTKYLKQ